MTETVSDKPWTFTGFGTVRCGRHTVLHLDINLSDEVEQAEYEKVGRLAAAAPVMANFLRSVKEHGLSWPELERLLSTIDSKKQEK